MKRNVLLAVDDNPDNLYVLQSLFAEQLPDCELLTALSAKEGLAVAGEVDLDGILADVQMPGISGIEMCRQLKSDERTTQVPVILVTAHHTENRIKGEGIEAGADDFLVKPIDNFELVAKIKVMLRIKHARDELRDINSHLDQLVTERTQELRIANVALGKRVKELDYFYSLSSLVEQPEITLEELLQEAADLIPTAWQYPEIAAGRIVLGEQKFKTWNFRETTWRQGADIFVRGERSGMVEVYYLEERSKRDEGPFLKEERKLIDAIAERLGEIIEHMQAEEELRILNAELEMKVEERTREIRKKVSELERFQEATLEREFRIKELRDELEKLKENTDRNTDSHRSQGHG